MTYEDILYEERDGTATLTINRPEVYNAFRPKTVVELIDGFLTAGWKADIGAIVLCLLYTSDAADDSLV